VARVGELLRIDLHLHVHGQERDRVRLGRQLGRELLDEGILSAHGGSRCPRPNRANQSSVLRRETDGSSRRRRPRARAVCANAPIPCATGADDRSSRANGRAARAVNRAFMPLTLARASSSLVSPGFLLALATPTFAQSCFETFSVIDVGGRPTQM